jgi:hypothetical protein
VGIQEQDKDHNYIRNTTSNVPTTAAYGTWEIVTTSVTVTDPNTAFCQFIVFPYGGTGGYFFIDDVYFSFKKPVVTVYDKDNMIQDPEIVLTESNADERYWGLANTQMDLELNTFNADGQETPDGNSAIKIVNRGTPYETNTLWEYNSIETRWRYRTFAVTPDDRFYIEAKVFESLDSDADDNDFKAVIWVGNNDRAFTSLNGISLRPPAKGVWETVSSQISLWKPNYDNYNTWEATATYNADDIVKYDGGDNSNIALYRCLNDGTSGTGTVPPNQSYWVRADESRLGNFGIMTENCTSGYFLIDDIILSRIDSAENAPNILFDPSFSVTTSETDQRHWRRSATVEWGSSYGYDASPGIRFPIDGEENWTQEMDGHNAKRDHPVKQGDRFWIQCRVKRSADADGGIFRLGIHERDKGNNYLRQTLADVVTAAGDEKWETVTVSVTVSDSRAVFCNLYIASYEGTTGYFFVDDIVFSRHPPP